MFEDLLKRLAHGLFQAKIPYMVIGGQAVLLYGEPRLTKDIDITLGLLPAEASAIISILPSMHMQPLVEDLEAFLKETFVLPVVDKKTNLRIDFIFSLSEYEKDAIKRAKMVSVQGTEVFYIGLEDLVIYKIIAGRPRDLEDIEYIIVKNEKMDYEFIRKILHEFDVELSGDFKLRFDSLLKSLPKKRKK